MVQDLASLAAIQLLRSCTGISPESSAFELGTFNHSPRFRACPLTGCVMSSLTMSSICDTPRLSTCSSQAPLFPMDRLGDRHRYPTRTAGFDGPRSVRSESSVIDPGAREESPSQSTQPRGSRSVSPSPISSDVEQHTHLYMRRARNRDRKSSRTSHDDLPWPSPKGGVVETEAAIEDDPVLQKGSPTLFNRYRISKGKSAKQSVGQASCPNFGRPK